MVSTRSKGNAKPADSEASTGTKRAAPARKPAASKKTKQDVPEDGKLEVGENGDVGLKTEDSGDGDGEKQDGAESSGKEEVNDDTTDTKGNGDVKEDQGENDEKEPIKSHQGETEQEGDEEHLRTKQDSPGAVSSEPKHGTLEAGHIYFLYRPKVEVEDPQTIDDVSKFHILLIPKTAPHDQGHYHRIIEVGKKKLPDPGAKHQVIWGLVGAVGNDQSTLKDSFGAYTYETKTRGTRHQGAARPAARGHYILHSPRDEVADSPDHDKQRDFKCLLAYEITLPTHEDFGSVQKDLGLAEKGAVVISVKDPNASSGPNNPRAAAIPREKKADYPESLQSLFGGRRWVPANPPSFLDYSGTEILIISSPHELKDSLGKDGEKVEEDMDHDAGVEKESMEDAMKELGMSKNDTEIEALEGVWA